MSPEYDSSRSTQSECHSPTILNIKERPMQDGLGKTQLSRRPAASQQHSGPHQLRASWPLHCQIQMPIPWPSSPSLRQAWLGVVAGLNPGRAAIRGARTIPPSMAASPRRSDFQFIWSTSCRALGCLRDAKWCEGWEQDSLHHMHHLQVILSGRSCM